MSQSKRVICRVKWFNNKAGFGFITMRDEHGIQVDVFTHYSTVRVTDTLYKYLVQGEYVEFDLTKSTNMKHAFQAANITGINGGNLMCETRKLNRPEKSVRQRRQSPEPPVMEDEFTKVETNRQRRQHIRPKIMKGEFKQIDSIRHVQKI